jgi:hypothetical protein
VLGESLSIDMGKGQHFAPLLKAIARALTCHGVYATGVYCTFDDLIEFLNRVIGNGRVIDVDESMLEAAFKNIGGGRSNIVLLYSHLNIPERVDFYLHVDLDLRRVCTLNKNNIIIDEAGEVRPNKRALKSSDNTAGETMAQFLNESGLVMFLRDTGLDYVTISFDGEK